MARRRSPKTGLVTWPNTRYPHKGGTDNKKGHMALTTYDTWADIAVDTNTETTSINEMRFVKGIYNTSLWNIRKNAIYAVDRAFIKARYWDQRKTSTNETVFRYSISILM